MHIPKIENQGKGIDSISKYLDFNKNDNRFYNNLFIDEYKFIIKVPLLDEQPSEEIKIEKFSFINDVFLISY